MALSDTSIRSIKPSDKVQKVSDGAGLYLHVTSTGSKLWRMAYRFDGKQKTLSFGSYPAVSLKEARARRDDAKVKIANGIDPGAEKKRVKLETATIEREQAMTFEVVAREWFERKTANLTPGYRQQILSRLENHLFPFVGARPFSTLEPTDILGAVRHTEARGAVEMAHRLVQLAGQVCRYARLCGYTKYDAAAGLNEALPPVPETKHRSAIVAPSSIGALLRAIETYDGDISILYALRILPYVFVRSQELRGAAWEEIDLDAAEWIIPAGRMKMKKPHIVPLARQVVRLFTALREHADSGLVFPSPFSKTRCITNMGLLNAIRRMGYGKDEMTVHGFRGMASTLLNEQGYRSDVIETQLAHGERNNIRAAYNFAQYLPERRKMMQEWADYLDSLRAGE
jgi:integrase